MESITALSDWLAQTSLSLLIADHSWMVPVLQSIHIIAVAIVLSSVAMLDLRLAGVTGRQEAIRPAVSRFYPWIVGALCVLVTTGFFQVAAEPKRELLNWIFWTKMGLIIGAVVVTFPARAMLEDVPLGDIAAGRRMRIRMLALVSLVLWLAVIGCGRWIAYAGGLAEG